MVEGWGRLNSWMSGRLDGWMVTWVVMDEKGKN